MHGPKVLFLVKDGHLLVKKKFGRTGFIEREFPEVRFPGIPDGSVLSARDVAEALCPGWDGDAPPQAVIVAWMSEKNASLYLPKTWRRRYSRETESFPFTEK